MNRKIQRSFTFATDNIQLNRGVESKDKDSGHYPWIPQNAQNVKTHKRSATDLTSIIPKGLVQSRKQEEHNISHQKLTDSKKRLNQSEGIMSPKCQQPKPSTSKVPNPQDQIKKRLQSKILQAHQKLEEIKLNIKQHQMVKAQIIAKSDSRRSSIKKSLTN